MFGARIQFWKDKWREEDITLKDKYPALYQVSQQQDLTINLMGQNVENGWDWKFQWRRNFFDHEIDMVAMAYQTSHECSEETIIDILVAGFSGQLKGWWDNYLTNEEK